MLAGPRTPKDSVQFNYPSSAAEWPDVELQARGLSPRTDTFEPSQHAAAQKRSRNKRAAALEKEKAKVFVKRPMTGGRRLEKTIKGYNQEIWRLFNTAPRPPFIPQPIMEWHCANVQAQAEGCTNMPDVTLATFILPIHLFFGVTTQKRVLLLSRLVTLWPTLLRRVSLAREDSAVTRLSTVDWRNILGDYYFMRTAWPVGSTFDPSEFYRYDGATVFGRELSTKL